MLTILKIFWEIATPQVVKGFIQRVCPRETGTLRLQVFETKFNKTKYIPPPPVPKKK